MGPVVEMLWESLDPLPVLRERFGFEDPVTAGDWVVQTLDRHWGIAGACSRIVLSGSNALAWVGARDGRLLMKWCVAPARFERLAAIARLTDWLDARGLPVSAPLPSRGGRLQLEVDGVSIGLQNWLDGDLLDVEDGVQVRAAGAVLARLQDALADYPHAGELCPADTLTPLRARITRWLDTRAAHVSAAARDALRGLLAAAPTGPLPAQLVHYDVRAANILCSGPEIVAVLDFEEARYEHRVVELARAATLLGTRFRDWGPTAPSAQEQLLAGYRGVRPLTEAERAWWDALLLWHALLMVPDGPDPAGWSVAARGIAEQVVGRI